MKVFFLVFARDEKHVVEKSHELQCLGFPYLIVCGKNLEVPNVVYRECRGKYDAINFGFGFVPPDTDIVVLNDIDTRIRNFSSAVRFVEKNHSDLVFARVVAREGPQQVFLPMLRRLRRIMNVAASGDLMLIRYEYLKNALPVRPCKAEDSYILFRVLSQKGKVEDCEDCYVLVDKTISLEDEKRYKERTVGGIYQALTLSNAPARVKFFYLLLPFVSPVLLISGKKGYSWTKGILGGLREYLRGDRSGYWKPI